VGTLLGTPTTMAPEVMFRKKYGLNVIILLYRLTYGRSALYSLNLSSESNHMTQAMRRNFMLKFSNVLKKEKKLSLTKSSFPAKLMIF